MNFQDIKEIIEIFNKGDLTKLDLELDGAKLSLKKSLNETNNFEIAPRVYQEVKEVVELPKVNDDSLTEVLAPVVGVFYAASNPGAKPYASVGQRVNAGDVLCLVEAMKMLSEIKAPVSGVVEEIKVVNEEVVEFGKCLMTIRID